MKSVSILGASVALLSLTASAPPAWAGSAKCQDEALSRGMVSGLFNGERERDDHLRQWPIGPRTLRAKGGGLTAGKSKISGSGTFSEVGDISELFGTYASADVHAGVVDSSAAQVVTKGTVSLALSGTGKGIDLGVTFGEFIIQKQSVKRKHK